MDLEIHIKKNFVKWAFKREWHFKFFLIYLELKIRILSLIRRCTDNEI